MDANIDEIAAVGGVVGRIAVPLLDDEGVCRWQRGEEIMLPESNDSESCSGFLIGTRLVNWQNG